MLYSFKGADTLGPFAFKGEKMVTANLWKIENDKYSIQFNRVKPKERKVIFEMLKDWRKVGTGFHSDGSEIFILLKEATENENVYPTLKQLPFPLTEEKKSGKITTIKTRYNSTKTRRRLTKSENRGKIKGKRSCSKCGQIGHNSRTCKA